MDMKSLLYLILVFSFSSSAMEIKEYIELVEKESDAKKILEFNLKSEQERFDAQKHYYLPVIYADTELKYEEIDNVDANRGEVKLNASSNLYSSDIKHKKNEANYKLEGARIALQLEREKLKIDVLKNVVTIYKYKELRDRTEKLRKESLELDKGIEKKFKNGMLPQSAKRQASLLIKKIDNEISVIEKQITLAKSNIKQSTGIEYPKSGITVTESTIKSIWGYKPLDEDLVHNLDYKKLENESNAIKSLAKQQDPAIALTLSGETKQKYEHELGWNAENKISLLFKYNFYNYGKNKEMNAQMHSYSASMVKKDLKFFEIKSELSVLQSLNKSLKQEIDNLEQQRKETSDLIEDLEKDYLVRKTTYYEILNTEFSYFMLYKQITELKIEFLLNKIDMMKLTGIIGNN